MTERTKQAKSEARNKRSNLLANLSKIRGGEASRTETLEIKEDEDVFDEVDEEEYQKIVEDRRKNTDFVVDDGK
jgi:DNA polymerase alpha subunit A